MWFSVLSSAVLYSSVAFSATAGTEMASGLAVPPDGVPDRFVAAAYRAQRSGEILHPLDASQGHAMWDPLGGGCIDGGGWDDPFPGGKGVTLSPPFCLSQPCMRPLERQELSRDVVGWPAQEVEWQTYRARHAQACGGVADWPVTALNLALGDEDTLAPYGAGDPWSAADPVAVVLPPKGPDPDRWRVHSSLLDPSGSSDKELLSDPALKPLTPVAVPPTLPLLLAGAFALCLARR